MTGHMDTYRDNNGTICENNREEDGKMKTYGE